MPGSGTNGVENQGMKRIVFLVSGGGTNMENLIKRMKSGEIPAEPILVICNRPEAGALDRASL